jgi:putative flippase GtrA
MRAHSSELYESSRVLKFLVVGPINALVSFLAFVVSSEIFNRALPSVVVATLAGWMFSYQMNKRFVWNNFSRGSFPTRFFILQSALISINWLTLEIMIANTPISLILGQAILIPFLAVGSFLGSELWVYPKNSEIHDGE